jgi:hypothetical protein
LLVFLGVSPDDGKEVTHRGHLERPGLGRRVPDDLGDGSRQVLQQGRQLGLTAAVAQREGRLGLGYLRPASTIQGARSSSPRFTAAAPGRRGVAGYPTSLEPPGREDSLIGTVLAGAVCRTYPTLKPVPAAGLRVKSALVKLPLAPLTGEDIMRAREVVKHVQDPKTSFLEKVQAYRVLDVAARDGWPLEVEVQVIALGDRVAWVSLPGEIFVELGLAIEKASPFRYTLIAELANGSVGYVPDRSAYAQGNYEVVSARCAEGSGELLVETAVRLLKEFGSTPPK